jgi:hypothetical protein
VHVAEGRESDVVKGVVGDIVLAKIAPAVLKRPEGERVELLALPDRESSALSTVVTAAAVDPAVRVLLLQGAVHGLDLSIPTQEKNRLME